MRILEAAVACLAEEGYAAATTSRIQERAGVSRGSLLHQFPAKDDLLIAAVQHLATARTTYLDSQAERTAGDLDAAIERALGRPCTARCSRPPWSSGSPPRTTPTWRAALAPREHELGRSIRTAIAEMFGAERGVA